MMIQYLIIESAIANKEIEKKQWFKKGSKDL